MENRKQKTQFYPKIQERMQMCNDCKTILHCRNKSPSIISFSHMFVFNLSVAVFSGSLSTHKIGSHNLLRKTTVLKSQRQETLPLFPLCPENVFWHNLLFKKLSCMVFFTVFITLTVGSHKNCYTIRNRLATWCTFN